MLVPVNVQLSGLAIAVISPTIRALVSTAGSTATVLMEPASQCSHMGKGTALRIQRMRHGMGTVLQTLQNATTCACAMVDASSRHTIPNRTKGSQFLAAATMAQRVTSMVIQQHSLITRAIRALKAWRKPMAAIVSPWLAFATGQLECMMPSMARRTMASRSARPRAELLVTRSQLAWASFCITLMARVMCSVRPWHRVHAARGLHIHPLP